MLGQWLEGKRAMQLDVSRVAPDPLTSAQHSIIGIFKNGARSDRLTLWSYGAGAVSVGNKILKVGSWIMEVGE
jgi:hypothetical protein